MKKHIFTGIALAALLTATATAAGFAKTKTYPDGKFADVPATEWYASEVKNTFELGLMNGTSDTTFEPNGNVTVAEAITMATRATSIYAGETIPAAEGEWYQMYVNYALAKGLIKEGQFDNYDRPAKRYEVASIFENAMPDGYFAVKNNVDEIPDVDKSLPYSEDLLTLYKAGVVMGSDSYGNFKPEDNIIRAEAAAIINRVALPENRLSRTLDKYSKDDAYTLVIANSYESTKEGITSGWQFDNRGGIPKTSADIGYSFFSDVSETDGVAMIREFNKVVTGKFTIDTAVKLAGGFDGFSIQLNNEEGNAVYKAYTKDGIWTILQPDGTYKTLLTDFDKSELFVFNIVIDLDNAKSTTFINKINCGTHPLATTGEGLNMVDFRFATDEKSLANVSINPLLITANYSMFESFSSFIEEAVPYGWQGYNAINDKGVLKLGQNGGVSKAFDVTSGVVIADFCMNLDNSQETTFDLKSGVGSVVKFTTDSNNFYANGVKVYENYVPNLWYRVRLELKTLENKAVIRVNGRNVAEVDFAQKSTSVDNVMITGGDKAGAMFDDIKIFKKIKHEDYVPVPVIPKDKENYTVGINICSLWRNGYHWGWAPVTPFDDIQPVLGYYDEGVVETADWEIKYMFEHGIDFQAFCWYPEVGNSPIKTPGYYSHLYDAYMYAEYSDMMKYCLIWEAANSTRPKDMNAWKEYFVPHIIEYFFKDDRYLVLDNKPVFAVFGSSIIAKAMGGNEALNEAFEYLEAEAKKLGFDGVIYLSSNETAGIASMGFDGFVAYNWGVDGYSPTINKNAMNARAKDTSFYTVPTVSVGFNKVAWTGLRYPYMTAEDFKDVNTWVRDEYLPLHQTEGSWNEKLVWLSTWNEYGEGTYLMPTTDEKGFEMLDVVREIFTDEKADTSLNLVPTEEQLYRINHLYPQHHRLLRKQGYVVEKLEDKAFDTLYTIDYSDEGQVSVNNAINKQFDVDGLRGTVCGDTSVVANNLKIDASAATHVRITIDVPKNAGYEVFFVTNTESAWSQNKGSSFIATSEGLASYVIDMSKNNKWNGTITAFRVDPGQTKAGVTGNDFYIKSLEFLTPAKGQSKNIIINENTYEMSLGYEKSSTGEILVAFDPSKTVSLDFKLGVFHTWNAKDKILTIEGNGHKLVYTVGASQYELDGKSIPLGFTLSQLDGLPLIPIEKLCKDLGFEYGVNEEKEVEIKTHQYEYFKSLKERKAGVWEFNTDGDSEGWSSPHMTLSVMNGSITATSNSEHRDPKMTLSGEVNLVAKKYKAFEIRCKFSHDSASNGFAMYFTTDSEPSMKEQLTITHKLPQKVDEWTVYTVDLTSHPKWNGIVKKLRFDPFNAVGTMEIDYMRFIEDENYSEEASAAEKTAVVSEFVFKNGSADEGVEPYTSPNATISVVEDDGKKVFFVKSNEGKQWTYIIQKVHFTPGATYKIEFDIKLLGAGVVTDGSETATATQFFVNVNYTDTKVDHVVAFKNNKISVADGWQHRTAEFVIPENSEDRSRDRISFYANPVGNDGANYFIDNIVVTEILPE